LILLVWVMWWTGGCVGVGGTPELAAGGWVGVTPGWFVVGAPVTGAIVGWVGCLVDTAGWLVTGAPVVGPMVG